MKPDVIHAEGRAFITPAPEGPGDEAQKRAIAHAVWTDLLWLMPPGRTVMVTVRDGNVAVDLGPSGSMLELPTH